MAENIVHAPDIQKDVFSNLLAEMQKQGEIVAVVPQGNAIPASQGGQQDPQGQDKTGHDKAPAPTVAVPQGKKSQEAGGGVTNQIANQGQLIPIKPTLISDDNSDAMAQIKHAITQLGSQSQNNQAQTQEAISAGGKSSGGGTSNDMLGTIANVALNLIGWIICTELVRQGKMPRKWWIKGAKVFAAYPDFVKQGYYLWAIPCVDFLRNNPDHCFSRLLCIIFNARARSIAEKTTIQGTAVTAILWPVCWALGAILWILNKSPDWYSVYRGEKT